MKISIGPARFPSRPGTCRERPHPPSNRPKPRRTRRLVANACRRTMPSATARCVADPDGAGDRGTRRPVRCCAPVAHQPLPRETTVVTPAGSGPRGDRRPATKYCALGRNIIGRPCARAAAISKTIIARVAGAVAADCRGLSSDHFERSHGTRPALSDLVRNVWQRGVPRRPAAIGENALAPRRRTPITAAICRTLVPCPSPVRRRISAREGLTMPKTNRHPLDPDHRRGADRHRPGLRVRLLRRPGLQGAARGGLPGRSW